MPEVDIVPMIATDIPEALRLWTGMPGITIRDADSPESLTKYLDRNVGLSFVAKDGPVFVGVVLGGHDGRRGFLHHVAVKVGYRRRGIAKTLVNRCLDTLKLHGIVKCHIFINSDNEEGKVFWEKIGWGQRPNLMLMSICTGSETA